MIRRYDCTWKRYREIWDMVLWIPPRRNLCLPCRGCVGGREKWKTEVRRSLAGMLGQFIRVLNQTLLYGVTRACVEEAKVTYTAMCGVAFPTNDLLGELVLTVNVASHETGNRPLRICFLELFKNHLPELWAPSGQKAIRGMSTYDCLLSYATWWTVSPTKDIELLDWYCIKRHRSSNECYGELN